MRRRFLLAASAVLAAPRFLQAQAPEIDLLLVLAADISHSMEYAELAMQRQGLAAAFRDPEVAAAIGSGPAGAIAVLYFEWSSAGDQTVLLPWTRLASAEDAAALAGRLEEAPLRAGMQTSISGAIAFSRRLIATAPFTAARRTIDISGDGENNQGVPVDQERDLAVEEGLTINGLPIIRHGQRLAALAEGRVSQLEEHYRDMVIGGAGAFMMPAQGFEAFAGAIRRKLVLEIAGLDGPASGWPAKG
jgi:hypothetical protein